MSFNRFSADRIRFADAAVPDLEIDIRAQAENGRGIVLDVLIVDNRRIRG
jgi:hypothetical protein